MLLSSIGRGGVILRRIVLPYRSVHRAKCRADRPTKLRDYAKKKKEKNKPQQYISPLSKLSLTGGLINIWAKTLSPPENYRFGAE